MNLPTQTQGCAGKAGAVELGGSANAAPANFTVGEIGFGPNWQDDEPNLRELYDAACRSIVRLECEADELRAEVALLREERAIMCQKLRSADALGTSLVNRIGEGA
jgi:hypothetical protein